MHGFHSKERVMRYRILMETQVLVLYWSIPHKGDAKWLYNHSTTAGLSWMNNSTNMIYVRTRVEAPELDIHNFERTRLHLQLTTRLKDIAMRTFIFPGSRLDSIKMVDNYNGCDFHG
ncbi:uncharacterized protein GVI51_L12463 [Nakaseomyces glabratus]|uniref:Uncharacterized protein n=1 Tax=Candida glabrata (strain ATCC 2001 / BCRC 20586 / JCM 3761 / NBRC 0622 / NRRL Y-65 / CBS 138) TaxID=284593 RepID=Q6FKD2_CANGA|nr:uncharacterized protein CAGL0L12518g [Nakaseomyces glabratus]QHS68990.1 uncharacterized protein GVI51_L12463 [Nakaseomyces glabratus]CAG62286.1 unnamed protein product [Nakaseomyces glabratus]|eukprot:XP_449312.1 uncharacterized protein CAGL0L12518g [[Candida] glabrata]